MPKKRVTPAASVDPFGIFVDAQRFHDAAITLDGQLAKSFHFAFPMIVNEAFSLELYLKCLLRIRGSDIPHEHNVKTLFGMLNQADQATVGKYFNEWIRNKVSAQMMARELGISLDLESVLERAQILFEKARYRFEGINWTKDATGHGGSVGVGQIIQAICRLVLEIHPEWESKYHTSGALTHLLSGGE